MLELKRLSVDDGLDIYTMLQEIPAEENGLINKANGLTFDEYKEWLIVKQRDSEQEGIVDGWKVPSTTFWLYADGIPVGFGSVRHFLTEALRKAGGNIGYGIAPAFRGKGYGKLLFSELSSKVTEKYNISSMILIVSVQWMPAKKIYESDGFRETKRIHGFFNDMANSDAIVMRKYL